jgi:uncharacterized protein YfiM (DUF2279 family)
LNNFFRLLFYLFLLFNTSFVEIKSQVWLKPSDTLNPKRLKTVVVTELTISSSALLGLATVWYNDYPKSGFKFKNDNNDWLQMDKAGHVFSAYTLGKFGNEALNWAGCSKKQKLIYGATTGFVFLTEILDGYSQQWGASWGDVVANGTGTAIFVSQELLWNEQRIIPKFSFQTTKYAAIRPNTLGKSLPEQVLKDYNGQTYWLSINLESFLKTKTIPKWLNLAIGYGVDGMVYGSDQDLNLNLYPNYKKRRQFYASLDVNLIKIETKSRVLKTIFGVFNSIKIPAPTIEINGSQNIKFHVLYF